MNGTTYNSAIEYHCVPTYERIGPYLRKCLDNGQWSGDQPRCESKLRFLLTEQKYCFSIILVAIDEPQEDSNLGTSIGIGAGVVVFLLVLLGIIYLKL